MSKSKITFFIPLIIILLSINVTLATLIFKTLNNDNEEESLYISSEKIVEDAAKFVLQHINYINTGNYDKAYNNFTKDFKASVSLDDYTFTQSLRKKLYSNYEFIEYTFESAQNRYKDNNVKYDKKMNFKFNMGCKSYILEEFFEDEYIFNVLYKDNKFYLYSKKEDYKNELALYYSSLAYVDLTAKDYNSSLANSLRGLRNNPNMMSIYFIKGQAEFMLNKYEDSIQSMHMALMANMLLEDRAHAYTTLAACHAYLGEFTKGKEFIDKALSLNPDDEFSRIVKADIEDNLNIESSK